MERETLHNDEPTLLDALGRDSLIKEVGEAIANCTPPQVFGVHGDWGLGKTSFLHQVQWYLTGDCPQQSKGAVKAAKEAKRDFPSGTYTETVQSVWFDAWRYQNENAPVVALLQEMRAQLSWQRQMAFSMRRGGEVAVRGALLSMEDLTKKIGFQFSKFQQANREWESDNLASSLPSHTLRGLLQNAIGQLLPNNSESGVQPRLAVFIDDVDRCEPEAAYRLLEGLKIYLTLDNCVFVLGMNQKAVEEAIAKRMETDEGPKARAAAYMEKLCQNVWRLATIRKPDEVLVKFLEKTVVNDTIIEWIKRAVGGNQCLPPNPRRLKGLANLIGRLSRRLPELSGEEEAIIQTRLLIIVAYIYQFHHDLYVIWDANLKLLPETYMTGVKAGSQTLPVLEALNLPWQTTRRLNGLRDLRARTKIQRIRKRVLDPTVDPRPR